MFFVIYFSEPLLCDCDPPGEGSKPFFSRCFVLFAQSFLLSGPAFIHGNSEVMLIKEHLDIMYEFPFGFWLALFLALI